ncbi:MAG: hypothetical protein IOC90_10645 [Methylocystis sp.]|nr:hypothetical protein [Methylocystis sp.]MCA3582761.1 hypothetical protein [Methylocystis sp.]MCA3588477.1 hypothetical protein [Methylocystis sp.]MCA3592058.1 hypothetical protein [Methylocystis sp.]
MPANVRRDGVLLTLAAGTMLAMLQSTGAEAQSYPRRSDSGEAIPGRMAVGAIINSARPRVYHPPVAEPVTDYARPARVYIEPEPYHVPSCHMVRRKVWLDEYAYTFRRERVCG